MRQKHRKAIIEVGEVKAQLDFVGDVGATLAKVNANGLLNPHHVGQIDLSHGLQ